MTDNGIIRQLELDIVIAKHAGVVSLTTKQLSRFSDLIKRQKAEIDGLQQLVDLSIDTQNEMNATIIEQKEEIERLKPFRDAAYDALKTNYFAIKSEAIKEFAERLKEKAKSYYFDHVILSVAIDDFDNLVKEMVGEDC